MSSPSATSGVVSTVSSVSSHASLRSESSASGRALVLLFTSAWHPPCKQMRVVCDALAKQTPTVIFGEVDAEEVSDVTELYAQVESVPTTVILRGGQVVDTLQGANAVELTALVNKHSRPSAVAAPAAAAAAPSEAESQAQLHARLGKLVRASPVMAFIKGTPDAPRCGFTKQLLALLKEQAIEFGSFDILSDQTVREGLKTFSNWPTYPQLYIDGELVGGLDVIKELAAAGELASMVPAGHIGTTAADALTARLKSLISQRRVMLFMKGSPASPQCGFSSKAVALLAAAGCTDYGSFDIFSDDAVREGLKEFSNWPTYPQLYIDGELIGGLDVMQEMHQGGELEDALNAPPPLEQAKQL